MSSRIVQKYFYVPQEAVQLLKSFLSEKDYQKYHQRFLYILHKVNEEYLFNWKYQKGSYVNLTEEYIRNITGDHVYKFTDGLKFHLFVIKFWKDSGWLECDDKRIYGSYGHKSYGYRFTSQVQNYALREYMLTDHILEGRIERHLSKAYNPDIPYLCAAHRYFNHIRINAKQAYTYIEKLYDITVEQYLSGDLKTIADADQGFAKRYNCFESDYHAIKAISEGRLFFSRSEKNKRIHNNLTSLTAELRQFLYFPECKGRLISVDARNSQPFLFNAVINKFVEEQGWNFKDYPDLELYKQLTSTGKFYDQFAKQVGFRLTKENRREFKEEVFKKLFYSKERAYRYQRIFGEKFPMVKQIIDYYKQHYSNKYLAVMMQKMEAEIFIDEIVKRIYEKNKDTFFLTLHDSIICLESDKEIVKQVCYDVFRERGCYPTLSEELFCENLGKETQEIEIKEIGDYDSDEETVEDSIQVSSNITKESKIEKQGDIYDEMAIVQKDLLSAFQEKNLGKFLTSFYKQVELMGLEPKQKVEHIPNIDEIEHWDVNQVEQRLDYRYKDGSFNVISLEVEQELAVA